MTRSAVRRVARLLALGWLYNLKMLARSAFDGILGILYPLFFATVAFLMFRVSGDATTLLYASLGSAVMGVWSSTSTTAGTALQRQRWQGTLELLVAAPVHFSLVMLPVTIAMTTIGLYSMVATIAWGRLLFGIGVHIEHPFAFALSTLGIVLAIGMTGFLFAVAFARFRQAWALGNMLEYPVWLIGGFLVPLGLLPSFVRPISWVLAPTWGMNAIREAALGGTPWADLVICLAIGSGYVLVGVVVLDGVLRAARVRATLALT
ncbi:MAG: ABC transporter permease [Gaiella sp.]